MIITENLTKQFGQKVAVNELSLHVDRGEFFSFLGPNGAGKTTTIKMLVGLLAPTSGKALIGTFDVRENHVAAKRLIGYIPDQPFLYEKLTGREFMRFVGGLYEMDDAVVQSRTEDLLELFSVREYGDQLIQDYSHGMRQKLSFSAAFLHDPAVVIVDEPWVGLDPRSIKFVKEYLKEKTRNGLTVFMSTHTLSIAEEISDTIGIINNGRLVTVNTVAGILQQRDSGRFEDVFLELTEETATNGG